jgi:hypothetical protein
MPVTYGAKAFEKIVIGPCTLVRTWGTRPEIARGLHLQRFSLQPACGSMRVKRRRPASMRSRR